MLAIGLGCLPAAAASAVPAVKRSPAAETASRPGWHVVSHNPAAVGVWTDIVTASGPRNAWASWRACGSSPCPGKGMLSRLQRWNGSGWQQVPVPTSLTTDAQSVIGMSSDSPADAWFVTSRRVVLRWNGHRLTAKSIPSWVVRLSRDGEYHASVSAFGPDNVWVFSLGAYASRYQHGRWTKAKLPVAPIEVSALSPSNIWLLGANAAAGNQSSYVLAHWNGKRWSTVTVPAVRVPCNSTEFLTSLAADSRGNVWLTRDITTGAQATRTLFVLRWSAGRWHRLILGRPTSLVSDLVPDGHGGIWLATNGPKPRYIWYLDHYNAGKWTRDSVPVVKGTSLLDVISLTWVPGSREVFAGANYLIPKAATGIVGAMLKYPS